MNTTKMISYGAVVGLIGFVFSGPIGFLLVLLTRPQPQWVNASVFVSNYHWIQTLPYFLGFFLVTGVMMVVVGHFLDARDNASTRFSLLIGVALTSVFAALVMFNYICQTTYVHNLATHYVADHDFAIAAFSMSNPLSLCWAIEMWAYAVLGVAMLLMYGYYRHNKNVQWLLLLNAIVSILSPILTIIDVNWVLTTSGLISYFAWNVLMIVLMIAIYRHTKSPSEINNYR